MSTNSPVDVATPQQQTTHKNTNLGGKTMNKFVTDRMENKQTRRAHSAIFTKLTTQMKKIYLKKK